MQGISSSPSDMGSTGIDSCKVIEEASPESPADTTKEDTLDSTGHRVRATSLVLNSQHLTSVHVIYGAQHVVRRAGQAADAQTAVRALVAWVGAARDHAHNLITEFRGAKTRRHESQCSQKVVNKAKKQ